MINSVEYRLAKNYTLNQLIWRRNKANLRYVNFTKNSASQRAYDMAHNQNLDYWQSTYFDECKRMQAEIDVWDNAIEIKKGEHND